MFWIFYKSTKILGFCMKTFFFFKRFEWKKCNYFQEILKKILKHLEFFFKRQDLFILSHKAAFFLLWDEKSSEVFIHFALRFIKGFSSMAKIRKFLKLINLMKLKLKKFTLPAEPFKNRNSYIVVVSAEFFRETEFSIYYLGIFETIST